MNYQFPVINNISQVLPLIAERKEFVVAVKDGYTVVNYVVQMADTFPPVTDEAGAILRELRGLVFSNETGAVIARRYHKFFNCQEKEETQINVIDFTQPHVILEKLDGSMITPIPVNGEIRWGTKMGCTDVAKPVEKFVAERPEYVKLAESELEWNRTPIFEWCSRQQAIVIDYPEDMLVLTAIRNNVTGEYASYRDMAVIGEAFGVPVVKAYQGTAANMQELLDQVGPMVGCEGFVVRFDSGQMLKVKCGDYLRKHKAKDTLGREKNVIELIVTEKMDDVKAFLDANDLVRVVEFEKKFWDGVIATANVLLDLRCAATVAGLDVDRRTFAVEFVQKQDEKFAPFLYKMFGMVSTADAIALVSKYIASSTGTQTKIDEVRWMFDCYWNAQALEE